MLAGPQFTEARTAHAATPQRADFFEHAYFPGSEELAPDEMRVVALGTGLPMLRRSQASSSWLVELGNGDKFLFDVGTGSQMNFPMLRTSFRQADKLFLSHLHSDHAGDFDALWIGGWVAGRYDRPLRVWGPSGREPHLGTAYFVEKQKEAWSWDITSRTGKLPAAGAEIEVHEFDFAKTQVVYEANGVTIRSFPAVHVLDGPVSYRLEWRNLTFVFSGDTTANRFFVENAGDADLLIHETYFPVRHLVERQGMDLRTATQVATVIHTSPEAAGRVFSMTRPRLAVAFHFYNDFDTGFEVENAIRTTYDGPLALARDGMVFNVTERDIRVRMLASNEDTWPEKLAPADYEKAKRGRSTPISKWLWDSRLLFE